MCEAVNHRCVSGGVQSAPNPIVAKVRRNSNGLDFVTSDGGHCGGTLDVNAESGVAVNVVSIRRKCTCTSLTRSRIQFFHCCSVQTLALKYSHHVLTDDRTRNGNFSRSFAHWNIDVTPSIVASCTHSPHFSSAAKRVYLYKLQAIRQSRWVPFSSSDLILTTTLTALNTIALRLLPLNVPGIR